MSADSLDSTNLIQRGGWGRRTYVKSPVALHGNLTVGAVREFVKALDEAGVPDTATVNAHRGETQALVQLSAYKQEYRDED